MMRLQILNLRGAATQPPKQTLQSIKTDVEELRDFVKKDVMMNAAWDGEKNMMIEMIAQLK